MSQNQVKPIAVQRAKLKVHEKKRSKNKNLKRKLKQKKLQSYKKVVKPR